MNIMLNNRYILNKNRRLKNSENDLVANLADTIDNTQKLRGSTEEIDKFARDNCRANRNYKSGQFLLGLGIPLYLGQFYYITNYVEKNKGLKVFVYSSCLTILITLIKEPDKYIDLRTEQIENEVGKYRLRKGLPFRFQKKENLEEDQLTGEIPDNRDFINRKKGMQKIIKLSGYDPYSI